MYTMRRCVTHTVCRSQLPYNPSSECSLHPAFVTNHVCCHMSRACGFALQVLELLLCSTSLSLSLCTLQVVTEADGYQPYLLSPEKGLRLLIKKSLELAKKPSLDCVDEVRGALCG